ncbi:MAG: hypothetical protein IJ055_01295, partial [Oscillospiraceae bacterium]|nr:hypothetical protein [Oscillospiraceae bacterium]
IAKQYKPQHLPADVLIAADPGCEARAVAYSAKLRQQGLCTEFALGEDPQGYAAKKGIARIVHITQQGETEVQV